MFDIAAGCVTHNTQQYDSKGTRKNRMLLMPSEHLAHLSLTPHTLTFHTALVCLFICLSACLSACLPMSMSSPSPSVSSSPSRRCLSVNLASMHMNHARLCLCGLTRPESFGRFRFRFRFSACHQQQQGQVQGGKGRGAADFGCRQGCCEPAWG